MQRFAALPPTERAQLLTQLSDVEKAHLAYQWRGWQARPTQLEPGGDWLYWLILAGRGFGKTRSGAEWVREQVKTYPRVGLIGKDALDMRSVMIEGESGILAVCPPWERPVYQASKRQLVWPNGAISECRTGEDPEGVRGVQFHRLWADEIAAWQYAQETWDMALLALRLGDDPRACITTTPKPIRLVKDLIGDPHTVTTTGTTFDNLENLGPTFQTIIARYEGTRLGRQELYAELLDGEGLAYRFSEPVHVVDPFVIPDTFERFESLDFGVSNPTAVLAYAVDYDGNLIVFDGLYEPGLPSQIVPLLEAKRARWWDSRDRNGRRISHPVYADPSIWNKTGVTNRMGTPASTADEFADLGVPLVRANNDRRAGFVRVSELLRQNEARLFPAWHPLRGQPGAPRMFVFRVKGTLPLREQLAEAPLEEADPGPHQGPFPGETVAQKWEGPHGHAHAALRYGVMARPSPSVEPRQELPDPRAEALRRMNEKDRDRESGDLRYLTI